jgi:hypothetical protein
VCGSGHPWLNGVRHFELLGEVASGLTGLLHHRFVGGPSGVATFIETTIPRTAAALATLEASHRLSGRLGVNDLS